MPEELLSIILSSSGKRLFSFLKNKLDLIKELKDIEFKGNLLMTLKSMEDKIEVLEINSEKFLDIINRNYYHFVLEPDKNKQEYYINSIRNFALRIEEIKLDEVDIVLFFLSELKLIHIKILNIVKEFDALNISVDFKSAIQDFKEGLPLPEPFNIINRMLLNLDIDLQYVRPIILNIARKGLIGTGLEGRFSSPDEITCYRVIMEGFSPLGQKIEEIIF